MKVFARVAAVLVAWGNWYALTTGGNPAELVELVRERGWSGVLLGLLFEAVFGLLIAEVVLRLMRSLLEGVFFARYAAMVAAVCFGGMLYGATLTLLVSVLSGASPNVYDIVPGAIERIAGGLVVGFIGLIAGGMIGLVEGLILGVPLAAILGLFRNAH